MKKYYQFINEKRVEMTTHETIGDETFLPIDFLFAIDIRNSTNQQINELFEEFEKYINVDDTDKKRILEPGYAKPWALRVDISQLGYNYGDGNNRNLKVYIGMVTSPGWGAGVKYMEDIITLEEFLNVGLEGVKDYIEMKNNVNKYNL